MIRKKYGAKKTQKAYEYTIWENHLRFHLQLGESVLSGLLKAAKSSFGRRVSLVQQAHGSICHHGNDAKTSKQQLLGAGWRAECIFAWEAAGEAADVCVCLPR